MSRNIEPRTSAGLPTPVPNNPYVTTIEPVTVTLRDGSSAEIRAVVPADRDRIVSLYAGMSPDSIRHRFFAAKCELSAAEVRFLMGDGGNHVVLAVVAGDRFLGSGRYVVLVDGGDTAEVAFEVADAEQGHGIGTLLLDQLARVARTRGITRFCAQVEADNLAMLDVFRHCGFAVRESRTQGIYDVEMQIADSEQHQSAVSTRAQVAAAARARREA